MVLWDVEPVPGSDRDNTEFLGAFMHSDGRPMLGRRLADKSQRELHDLGLVVDQDQIREVGHRADGETGQQG